MENILHTVYVQYQNSPILVRLIENMNAYIDPRVNFDNFINQVWDINTAEGWGLDVLGRIVGVKRVLTVTAPAFNLGFADGLSDYAPFGQAPFYNGAPQTSNFTLSDPAFRQLILTKAFANICAMNASSLNTLLSNLFAGRGRCYVNDLGNMQMRYTFEFALQPYEISILENSGAIPHSTGVLATAIIVTPSATLGFAEADCWVPFGQGTFASPSGSFPIT